MTINEMMKNPELLADITEDLEDFDANSEVVYEVWALGYTEDEDCTDDEILVGEFTDPDEAVAYAEKVTLGQIKELGYEDMDSETVYFSIEVETVVEDPEEEGTMNLGTVYSRVLWLDGEYGSEEEAFGKDYRG